MTPWRCSQYIWWSERGRKGQGRAMDLRQGTSYKEPLPRSGRLPSLRQTHLIKAGTCSRQSENNRRFLKPAFPLFRPSPYLRVKVGVSISLSCTHARPSSGIAFIPFSASATHLSPVTGIRTSLLCIPWSPPSFWKTHSKMIKSKFRLKL